MGLPHLLADAAHTAIGLVLFILSLATGSAEAREALAKWTSPPSQDAQDKAAEANKVAKRYRPRRLVIGDGTHRLAEEGERGGMLYDVFGTGLGDMHEFGLGIGTFFVVIGGYSLVFLIQAAAAVPSVGELAPRPNVPLC
jgi:hypothetical protein